MREVMTTVKCIVVGGSFGFATFEREGLVATTKMGGLGFKAYTRTSHRDSELGDRAFRRQQFKTWH